MSDQMSVLVVDDERAQRFVLRQYLANEGYEVVEADSGINALDILRQGRIDIALIDLMMPGIDGLELIRLVRQESAIPIIVVTARGEESKRVAGLELGADDYVVKPFSMPELIARVRARLRQHQGGLDSSTIVRIGDLELDVDARRCSVSGRQIELTRREFDLLAVLVQERGRVLGRSQLLAAAWGTTFLTEKTVDVHLNKLRAKIGDAVTVTAVRGIGYRLER